jgi:hypothetical protein
MKAEKFNTFFKRHMAFRKADESLVCSEKELKTVSSNLHYYIQKTKYNF